MAEDTKLEGQVSDVVLHPWSEDDLQLLEKLLSYSAMMHLGGPEREPGKARSKALKIHTTRS